MEVNSIKRESVAEQIFGQPKAKIVSGELRPGDKLPTEMELCEMYGVSRTSVRQALTNLSSMDLIEAKTGGGTFVKKADASRIMDKLVLFTFLDERSLSEIAEFRSILEPAVARLACQRATPDDIEKLEERSAELESLMVGAATDFPRLMELTKEKEEVDAEIERKMDRYIELQEMVDSFANK